MRREYRGAWLAAGVVAVMLVLATAASAQVCGNGLVEPGEECDLGTGELCGNRLDDDADGVADCQDSDCLPEGAGAMFVCGAKCRGVPVCQPLLDDPAKIKFRFPKRLDFIYVAGSAVPLSPMDPAIETVDFLLMNDSGIIYHEAIPMNKFISNTKQTVWKYVVKKTGSPMIYNAKIVKKYNKTTAETYFLLKFKAEADAAQADPVRNTLFTEAELANMFIQISVGDDTFYNSATWERKPWGWFLADKYLF